MFSKAKWKREVVQNHKFNFVYVEDFRQTDPLTKLKYVFLYLLVLKIFLIYVADVWTAGILLISDKWSSTVQPVIEFDVSKWIYVGCIFMSFILLIWDWNEAISIIASKDIGQALTSIVAYRYYALRSFSHYGFFCKINKQKKKTDDIAFFVFFTFKGWKRLILADAPRQIVNATTLYSIIQSNHSGNYLNVQAYDHRLTMALMAITFMSFVVSASLLALAFILYVPLLFHIRGNLKEYCCHKIDKRIDELVKNHYRKRNNERKKIARAEAKGDFTHLKKRKHKHRRPRRQPTLPDINDVPPVPPLPPVLPPVPVIPMTSRPPPPYLPSYNPNLHPTSPTLPYNHSPSLRPTYNSNPQYLQNSDPRSMKPQSHLNPPRVAYNLQTSQPSRSDSHGYVHNSNFRPPLPNTYHSNVPGRPYI